MTKYKMGKHPKSIENLIHEGRPTLYEAAKRRREVVVTDSGWDGFKATAKELGCSASELIERIGRGLLKIGDELD